MTTPRTSLSLLLAGAGVQPVAAVDPDPEILGVSLDSRRVAPGHLFFALRGAKANGIEFVPDAVERGACAIVAADPRPSWLAREVAWVQVVEPRLAAGLLSRECHGRPDEGLTLVGITGTNGKTTVAHLVESIARAGGRRTGRIGTVGYAFGEVERSTAHTTPEAPDLYRLLAEMREEEVDLVSMEVSSHALALDRVAGAHFATVAFLNLGRDHLDFHGSTEAYFRAKARLFEALEASQYAVLPADDPWGARVREGTRARVISFGRSSGAGVRLTREHSGLQGSSAVLEMPSGALPVRSFLLGRFNLDNIAAAAACALAVGLTPEAISAGVLALQRVPGRVEPIDRGQPFTVIVDYAHTEEALVRLLAWVGELARGRVRVVFGAGGDRDPGKRAGMGRAVAASGAEIYLTSDNPRGEDPEEILGQIAAGVAAVSGADERCRRIVDRAEAIRSAIEEAQAGDVVVLAGKGHETVQTIGERTLPFDDRRIATGALEGLGFGEKRGA